MSAPLPPGQIETKRFPVVGERQPSADLSNPTRWSLEVTGLVERPIEIGLDGFLERAKLNLVSDIHCVTALSATRFQEEDRGADVTGARFDGSWGLTESQEDYLASRT